MTTSDKSPMTPMEEHIAFYYYLGAAISCWATVESGLYGVISVCFTKHNTEGAGIAFFSIENFRSKLQAADRLFHTKFHESRHIAEWEPLHNRLERLSQIRNHLVHYHTRSYWREKPGRRVALIPTLSDKPKFVQKIPLPPSGSLCLREIAHARLQFEALGLGLQLLYGHVKKLKPLPSASVAQEVDVPTMAQLTHQIRTILSTPPSP